MGVAAAGLAVDTFRNVYTLNYASVAGLARVEPSLSQWVPAAWSTPFPQPPRHGNCDPNLAARPAAPAVRRKRRRLIRVTSAFAPATVACERVHKEPNHREVGDHRGTSSSWSSSPATVASRSGSRQRGDEPLLAALRIDPEAGDYQSVA